MIEFGVTPVSTSLLPCRLTPREFKTISDGTTSGLDCPIVFCSGTCGGEAVFVLCADAAPAAIDKLAANISAQAFRDNVM
jgi:hypothetical protein